MLLALLLSIFALCLYRIRFNLNGFNEDYLSKDNTNSIKGIFILLIVISHSLQYIRGSGYSFSSLGDMAFNSFFSVLGQMVVIMFLFYSGYGVCESYKRKKRDYISRFPRHRILVTLLNYEVAVIIYMALSVILGLTISVNQSLIALTGWTSIGIDRWGILLMDNWYIFVILLCYLMTYILFYKVTNPNYQVVLLSIMCIVCVLILSSCKDGEMWYNTLLCYPTGYIFSTFKEKIEVFIKRTYWNTFIVLITMFIVTFSLYLYFPVLNPAQLLYNLVCIFSVMIIVMLTMKFGIGNPVLNWLGSHLFPIFIYMRLPMIFMEYQSPSIISTYPALFILTSLAVTLLIAHFYKHWEIRLQ